MSINKIKDELTNVSLNYSFFDFQIAGKSEKKFTFPIEQIRSFNNSIARQFYKPVSRAINLDTEHGK